MPREDSKKWCTGTLKAAEIAKEIGGIEEVSLWMYYAAKGKALYHMNQTEDALITLIRAEELLAPKLLETNGNEHLLSTMHGINWYLNKIDGDTHSNPKPADA